MSSKRDDRTPLDRRAEREAIECSERQVKKQVGVVVLFENDSECPSSAEMLLLRVPGVKSVKAEWYSPDCFCVSCVCLRLATRT